MFDGEAGLPCVGMIWLGVIGTIEVLYFSSTGIHKFLVHLDGSSFGRDILFIEVFDIWESYLVSFSMPKSCG